MPCSADSIKRKENKRKHESNDGKSTREKEETKEEGTLPISGSLLQRVSTWPCEMYKSDTYIMHIMDYIGQNDDGHIPY